MALVNRPFKVGGTTNYVDEVALGNTTILAAEVDDDLNTLYDEFNGNIDNANIKVGANIATSKLALDGGLQTGHYADGSVTLAKLAANSVDSSKIVDGSITGTDIDSETVTSDNLVPGATVPHQDRDEAASTNFTTESELMTLAAFTPADTASVMTVLVAASGQILFAAANTSVSMAMRLKRNGTTIRLVELTSLLWPAAASFSGVIVPWSLSIAFLDTAQTVAVTYSVTFEAVVTGTATVSLSDGDLAVVEHR